MLHSLLHLSNSLKNFDPSPNKENFGNDRFIIPFVSTFYTRKSSFFLCRYYYVKVSKAILGMHKIHEWNHVGIWFEFHRTVRGRCSHPFDRSFIKAGFSPNPTYLWIYHCENENSDKFGKSSRLLIILRFVPLRYCRKRRNGDRINFP